ncbi:non-lysosomal glucosylceramidase-like [Nilaparvata lugens]|uniref:non-lysosomal glucosylceramidase-like n=1 Tax=Nilaparvata lugens TaxID=108931 RepID=UPI00193CCD13|nr:non-lysosomal glucosylceramidase-like [Nilaparvata lugens]
MRLPAWFKSALFNETYYISDGGTVWLLPDKKEVFTSESDPRSEFGRFGYLEGHEYRMYNTYDVHFYASFALAHLWPKLQASIQYDYRDTILLEDRTRTWFLYNGEIGMKKKKSAVPHDMGDPGTFLPFPICTVNVHAYCGGLWVASLFAMHKMAEELNAKDASKSFKVDYEKAKIAYQAKLWNGISRAKCESALQMIYKMNVQSFCKGEMGAVNGMKPNGSVDRYAIQSEEVWTGVTYGLSALFIHKGMNTEAFSTAEGIYNTVYNQIGLGFQTPEALYENCNYRSIGYMRPLSIWSIYNAWVKTNEV